MGFAEELVKVDLHCHLDGSMEADTVEELLRERGIIYPMEELEQKLRVSSDCVSLAEYLKTFDLPLICLQTASGLKRAAFELVRSVSEENVKYIEVRFAPLLSVNSGLNCRTVIESVVQGLQEGYRKYGVYSAVIVCAMRHHSVEANIEMLKIAWEFLGNGVCGLDLAGDESAYPTKKFRELFSKAKEGGMPFTIHAGECGSVEEVKEAIGLGAKRIGHGIALAQSESLQSMCRERRIGIEMCPTSNRQTKAVENLAKYPMNLFLKNKLLVSINTDNRTVSNTTMTKEIELVMNELHLSKEAVRKCMRNAIETSFASEEVKHRLIYG